MINFNNFVQIFIICHLILLKVSLVFTEKRVINGEPTTIDKAPFLVQLYVDGRFHCGGTLVSDQIVVTAAHCVQSISPDRFTVVGGASKRTDYGIRSSVKKIFVPRVYNSYTFNADVAVIKLRNPIKGPSVQPASFCKKPFSHGDPVKLFGWGRMYENVDYLPLQIQTTQVSVIDRSICALNYYGRMSITDTMFCAAAPGKDACSGDSGGPVIVNGEYCGIVSWGIGCGHLNSPGVYTSIPKMLPFITAAMQQ